MEKTWTVIKKEFMTDGIFGICLIVSGIANMYGVANFYTTLICALMLVLMLYSLLMRRKKSDPWDEMTRENYACARRTTINVGQVLLMAVGLYLLFTRNSFTINIGVIIFLLGGISLVQVIAFYVVERREKGKC